jgi:hypothetical protein
LLQEVILLVENVVTDTSEVSVLEIGIEVDLDDTRLDSSGEFLLSGARSTVEDEEQWLVLSAIDLLLGVGLMLSEKLWVELDVSWLVDTVDVSESGGDGEVWGDGDEGLVDIVDILWLGVEGSVVDVGVVDTILLTTSDTNLHLDPLLHWGSTLSVLLGDGNVLLLRLFRQVNHVGTEERLAMGLEVSLIGIEKAVQPWEKLLCAVVGVEDDWDTVCWGNGTDVVGSGDTTLDGSVLAFVGDTL